MLATEKKMVNWHLLPVLRIRILDPGSGAFLTPGIRDPRWLKNQDPDPGSGSGMNNPDHISESLETIFLMLKYLNFLCGSGMEKIWIRDPGWKNSDPGSGVEKSRIRDKDPGSATLIILTCFADLCSSGPVHKHRGGYRNTERIEYNA